jgi:hypothetical protein
MTARRDRLGFLDSYTHEEKELLIPIFQEYQKGGFKIEAIKKIRTLLNTGLVESKDLIECMEEFGIDEILKLKKQNRFDKFRTINLESTEEHKLVCPICGRDANQRIEAEIEAVAVVTSSGEQIGYFCRKCYDYLTLDDVLAQVKRRIARLTEFLEHLQKSNAYKNNT